MTYEPIRITEGAVVNKMVAILESIRADIDCAQETIRNGATLSEILNVTNPIFGKGRQVQSIATQTNILIQNLNELRNLIEDENDDEIKNRISRHRRACTV